MSRTGKDLVIIYETESNQWAASLHSLFSGHIWNAEICRFDIATVSSQKDDFLQLAQYKCKVLLLTSSLLRGLGQTRRFFLSRVLSPAAHVVVLLCGVDSLRPLLELVPLSGDECIQISKEQDASRCLSAVADIVRKAPSGVRSASSVLLQRPGAQNVPHTTPPHGHTPTKAARSHSVTELRVLMNKELQRVFSSAKDKDVASEMTCRADVKKKPQEESSEENIYEALWVNDDDIPSNSEKLMSIVNRPPAPIPRPESTQVKESKTPYIAQVFQKKTTTDDGTALYARPLKRVAVRGRADDPTSTCDPFEQTKLQRPQQLGEPQRAKPGRLNVDEAPERPGHRQEAWRGKDAKQQETLNHLQAGNIKNTGDSDHIYDSINAINVHHMPCTGATVNESRRGSQPVESHCNSKPIRKK